MTAPINRAFIILIGALSCTGCQMTGTSNVIFNSNGTANGSSTSTTGILNGRTTVIQASASDNVGVTKVEFYVNQALICTVTTAPYNCSWNVPSGPGVRYQLQSKAYDQQGNVGSSQVVTVTSR